MLQPPWFLSGYEKNQYICFGESFFQIVQQMLLMGVYQIFEDNRTLYEHKMLRI